MTIMRSAAFNRVISGICLLAMFLSGCGAAPDIASTATSPVEPLQPSPDIVVTLASVTAPATPPAAESPDPGTPTPTFLPLPQYTLTATLDYAAHHLVSDEQIVYTNRTGETMNELVLMIPPLDFPGVFTLQHMEWEDGVPVEGSNLQSSRMDIPLRTPLAPGEAVSLHIAYELQIPSPTPSAEVRPIPFGYTARQTNLVDWYPFVAPYIPGKGWLAHKPGYFGEHLVYEDSDIHVNLRLESDRPEMTVAASALETKDGEWRHYSHPSARNFAWSVSPQYQVAETDVGNTKVISYFFPYHQAAGEAALKTTAEALALYNERFGDYRHPVLSVVEADFLDGMEYDGLYFLSNGFYNLYQGTPGEYLVAIAAHETAHQWFYGAVGNDQALEPWLDEALCTYAERLYFENLHPEAIDWWWDYRVQYYQPSGWVDSNVYNSQGYRAYRDAVYLNGAMFLEDLRTLMGDSAFFAFLRSYVTEKSGQIVTQKDFFTGMSQFTSSDTSALLKKYFSNP
jgi:hypothetical protein